MKKNIYIFYCLILIQFAYSQINGDNNFKIQIKSPAVTSFIKYGNISSLSYTGTLNYQIPLLSTPTEGVNPINISLQYDGSGFRPTKRSGLVGLNWFLNVGGVITREINGVADDQMGEISSNGATIPTNGFIVGVRNKIHNAIDVFNINNNDLYYNVMNFDSYLYGNNNHDTFSPNNYEGNPDVFSFNFNGFSGKFVMGNDGLVKIIGNESDNLKIDLSGMQNQNIINLTSKPSHPSLIVITDNSGNKYYFGGESKNLEYSININSCSIDSNGNGSPTITAWHLNRIEYINGKTTNFIFRDDSGLNENFSAHPIVAQGGMAATNPLTDFIIFSEYISEERALGAFGDEWVGGIGPGTFQFSQSMQKTAILDQIIDDDYIINFGYSKQAHSFNTRDTGYNIIPASCLIFASYKDIKLDNINFYSKNGNNQGALIKNISFNYSYLGGSIHSRMFLTSITKTGEKPYLFEYNDPTNLPKPVTLGIDHWGFWNGKNADSNILIPQQNYNFGYDATAGDYSSCTSAACTTRNPSFEFSNKGNLSKVIYPTGGYTSFIFEAHDYNYRLEARSTNDYNPSLYNVSGVCGGTRIQTITDFDGLSNYNEKKYFYLNDNGLSSGILLNWPRYLIHWKLIADNTPDQELVFAKSNSAGNIVETSVITYSQVIEKTIGNGYKKTKFTDFITNPDENVSNFSDNAQGIYVVPKNLARNYRGLLLNDKSIERGKPLLETIYDNNNNINNILNNINIIQEVAYIYNNDVAKYDKFTTKVHLSGPSNQFNKTYYYQDYLTQKRTKLYTSTGNLETTENYTYTGGYQYNTITSCQDVLFKKGILSSQNNELVETQYKYPWNIYSVTSTDFINFQNSNLILPISESKYRNNIKLSEKFTYYLKDATTNNIMLPKYIYDGKFPNTFPNISGIGSLEKKVTINSYDSRGNVTQYTLENGQPVSVIWGYNQTRPIAKIENVSYSSILSTTITDLQSKSNVDINNSTEIVLITALNNLRTTFPNAMITTYTHDPLVGVTSITDAKGDVSTFEYDAASRLKTIKDKNGKLINEFQYHFKN